MGLPRVGDEALQRIERVLDMLSADLLPTLAPWYLGREVFARDVVERVLTRFEQAFDRWRDLFAAAEQQREDGGEQGDQRDLGGPHVLDHVVVHGERDG